MPSFICQKEECYIEDALGGSQGHSENRCEITCSNGVSFCEVGVGVCVCVCVCVRDEYDAYFVRLIWKAKLKVTFIVFSCLMDRNIIQVSAHIHRFHD